MNQTGKKLLRVIGIFELSYGFFTLAMIWMILSTEKVATDYASLVPIMKNADIAETVLWQLCFIYGCIALQIIGGFVAICLANKQKKYKICLFFGVLLLLSGIASITMTGFGFMNCFIQLIVPVLYILAAITNKGNIALNDYH